MMLRNSFKSIVTPLSSFRLFSTSTIIQNKQIKPLYQTPSKWINLSPEEILDLHNQRKYYLGTNYQKSQVELDALLKTSSLTGVKPSDISKIYWGGDKAIAELNNYPTTTPIVSVENSQREDFNEYPLLVRQRIDIHRRKREYNRIAAYEMPHLIKYRQEFNPKEINEKPLKFKYISILGEENIPINKKVVMTCKSKDLGLKDLELHKLRLLIGERYNYRNDEVKISCDKFPEPLQNTRYILDTVKSLIKEAKFEPEQFKEIPLDKRHILCKDRKRKNKKQLIRELRFPKEWNRPQDAPIKEKSVVDHMLEQNPVGF